MTEEQRVVNAARARKYRASMTPEQKRTIRDRENALRRLRGKTPEQKERQRKYLEVYRAENKKHISELNHALYLKNKEHIKAYHTEYYAANKPVMLAKNEARRKARREKYSAARLAGGHRRRVRRRTGRVDPKGILDWMKQIRSLPFVRCHWCGTKVKGRAIQFDHVIAVALGGSDTIGNYCAACRDCNSKKHARALTDWVVNGQTFLPV